MIKSTGSRYLVRHGDGTVREYLLRGRFRVSGARTTNPLAVGDNVTVDPDEGIIVELTPRKNYIIRRASNLSKESQILAANIDQASIVLTVKMPATPIELVDRFLATAEAYRIPAILIINKSDLYDREEMAAATKIREVYEKVGYTVFIISATTDRSIEPLERALAGQVTLLAGNSGVGKSTLINRLNPSLELRTSPISGYHEQGVHVTTFPEMHPMPGGGYIIDTPGIRGFGVIDFDPREVYHFFPEIFRVSSGCRFSNCLHLDEPGCAVTGAVALNEIEPWRYRSYLSMVLEDNEKYR